MATPKKHDCMVRALENLGAQKNERSTSRRYSVFDVPHNIDVSVAGSGWAPVIIPAGRYWVGSAGALRKGRILTASISLTGGAIAQRLEDYGQLLYTDKGKKT